MLTPAVGILTLEALRPRLARHGRLMGLDLGTKTIGLALSDVERRIATPLDTIRRAKFQADAHSLASFVGQFAAKALILGLPLNMDGSEGPRAQSTRAFARNLLAPLAACDIVGIVLWDERLSTAAVERALIGNDVSRKRRAQVIDKMAAAYILQGALDRLANLGREAAAGSG